MDWRLEDPPEARFFAWDLVRAAWEAIDPNLGDLPALAARELHLAQASACPRCQRAPADLTWLCVATPAETWTAGEGRVGWLTICERCALQVDFIVDEELTEARRRGDW